MKLLELFCGAGSFSLGMKRNGIEHEIVGFSDIRKSAIKLFCALHGKDESENLGDVKNINAEKMEVDIVTFGSPCQSFTRAGRGEGGFKGSDTKSALMWEAVRIIEECTPKIVIWENVPDAINKKNINNFLEYIEVMKDNGFNTYYKIIDANKNGSVQKRKRLFAVSISRKIDNGKFKFLEDSNESYCLKNYICEVKPGQYLIEEKIKSSLVLGKDGKSLKIKNATKLGYALAEEFSIIDTSFPNSKTRRGRVQKNAVPTLLRSKTMSILKDGEIRYLTPQEYWNIQEMPKELFKKVLECNFSEKESYDVIGGVINQKHLDVLFKSLNKFLKEIK